MLFWFNDEEVSDFLKQQLMYICVRIRKVVLKKKENREKAASFIREESEKLGTLFMRLSHATTPKVITINNY